MAEDPEPVMQQAVRVFLDDGTFCPGFQFTDKGQLRPAVTALFRRAMELRIAHNHFSAWMITPTRHLDGARPVDVLDADRARLRRALEAFGPG